jgi:hypothetical protein
MNAPDMTREILNAQGRVYGRKQMADVATGRASHAAKAETVTAVYERFKSAKMAIVTEYRGLSVAQMTRLRRDIRQASGEYQVIKNTLVRRALHEAILATGAIQKRPIVVEDEVGPSIAVRDMVYLCLTYDHRLLDGADAARFVTEVKRVVEEHDWAGELGVS